MRKILVTGGAGFIGSSLSEKLLNDPDNFVVIVDDLSTGKNHNLPKIASNNWEFVNCDANKLEDMLPVMVSHKFDFVFHYAAVVGVQRTLQNPIAVLKDIDGIRNILHLSKNTGVKRVLYASSSEVYGESVRYPQDEIVTPLNSRLPYAVVKNVGESFCRSYKQEFDLDYTIFRFFNTYGPKQSEDFVMSKFVKMALNNEDITIYGDGQQQRTFCFIDDNIDTCIKILNNDLHINDVVNVGSNIEFSIEELAKTVIEVTKSKSKLVFLPPLKEGDMKRRCPDVGRMDEILGRERIGLKEGLSYLLQSKKIMEWAK